MRYAGSSTSPSAVGSGRNSSGSEMIGFCGAGVTGLREVRLSRTLFTMAFAFFLVLRTCRMMLDRLYLLSMLNLDTGSMLGDAQLRCGL